MANIPRLSAEARKEAIVEAVRDVFAEKGFEGTTTRDLAKAAGVSEALLYKHFPSKESLYAAMDRFRPILMTTLAAVFGAIPIALGFGTDAASRRPLGLVIVGGLVVSQFITLFITPVIYLYLEDFQEKVLNRTSFFRSEHGAAAIRSARGSGSE